MAEDDDLDDELEDDDEDSELTDEDLREALRSLKNGNGSLGEVLAVSNLVGALPAEAMDAIAAVYATQGDLANGGMDQVVWNHGLAPVRDYARAWTTIGAIENGELLVRLADELAAYYAQHDQAEIEADPVTHFSAYRRAVGGPEFSVPEPMLEVSEAVTEYVIARADSLPDPDAPLPPRHQ